MSKTRIRRRDWLKSFIKSSSSTSSAPHRPTTTAPPTDSAPLIVEDLVGSTETLQTESERSITTNDPDQEYLEPGSSDNRSGYPRRRSDAAHYRIHTADYDIRPSHDGTHSLCDYASCGGRAESDKGWRTDDDIDLEDDPLPFTFQDDGATSDGDSEDNRSIPALPENCGLCNAVEEISWCNICDATLCPTCWDQQAAHKSKNDRKGARHGTHEKMSLDHRNILQWILESRDASENGYPHLAGYGSKWFGVTMRHSGVSLDTTSRYRELSIDVNADHEQYPSLISFVGETGAGKSTMINALIKIKFLDKSKRIQTPVIGHPKHLNTPTSGDVHLFADPSTGDSDRPYLYADCEGMEGGTKIPVAVRAVSRVKRMGLKSQRFREIRLKWAHGELKTRQWIVKQFFPRVLFTFSDVVVYVTKNFRTIHKVISRLISWADTVLQTSVNQPMLPYAIIVVNALEDENEGSGSRWWTDNLTEEELSEEVGKFVETDPFIWGLIEQWRERDKEIVTLKDLVLCYYSGIQIICIPHTKYSDSPSILITQYNKLHKAITTATTVTRLRRREAELLMNSEELDIYFGYAFDHFSINPNIPFNFLSAAFHHNPVRATFKTHILKTAIYCMNTYPFDSGAEIFDYLAPLVASSILLDVCRKSYPQKYNAAEDVIKEYEPLCRAAIQEFYKGHWPCSFVDNSKRRCVNVSTKHQKGHQIEGGRVVAVGAYVQERYYRARRADGDYFVEEVSEQYQRQLRALIDQVGHPAANENSNTPLGNEDRFRLRYGAAENQRTVLRQEQFSRLWNTGTSSGAILSHSTCYGCLFSAPTHPLPCGHVLCDPCVEDFSRSSDPWLEIDRCPLCGDNENSFPTPWRLMQEHQEAAPRILSLDGGGIRSVMQLVILSKLEEEIDLGLPIYEFFDLIIGTSAGGIIALGLGICHLSVQECSDLVQNFATNAFTKRTGCGLPGVGILVEAINHSQYETAGLTAVLKSGFGENANKRIFGETHDWSSRRLVRAGVTLTSSTGHPYFVSNYNRPLHENAGYEFFRAENKKKELKVWEAARATSAAPRFFKPFRHDETGRILADGALCFNNPVEIADNERKLLWPRHTRPDILLSIGTGMEQQFGRIPEAVTEKGDTTKWNPLVYLKRLKGIVSHQAEMNMNSQKTWNDFLAKRRSELTADDLKNRHFRFNVEFPDQVPKLDHVEGLDDLKALATKFCSLNRHLIRSAATKLIASLFYLRVNKIFTKEERAKFQVQGTILCRLKQGSAALDRLRQKLTCGKYFALLAPLFYTKVGPQDEKLRGLLSTAPNFVKIGNEPFELNIDFRVGNIDEPIGIYLGSGYEKETSALISGFPSSLVQLKKLHSSKIDCRSSDISECSDEAYERVA